ncbi:sensor histidine kinase [Streptomyces sp. TRM66268-LWL]|uniref:histidine kinase n=1 Tax=Streptomyces polyasparticus TaxID=2767826 RepID=A0ABR7STT3_9ACTN|nr:histidine kinase [Streptomyces polyasparticus]MBC9718304.1 sensor histidine kinase [Streptomyces polyasparticus]
MTLPPADPLTARLSERGKDLAVVLAVAAVVVGGTFWSMRGKSETFWQAVTGWVIIALACGALYFRRRWPVGVALFTLAACAVYYPLSVYDGPVLVTFVIALYAAAAEGRFVAAVAIGVAVMLMIVYGETQQGSDHRHVDDAQFMMLAGWLLSILVLARAQRTRAAYLEEVRARALAAEREQEARAQQSATEERLRIAREVHDVLGHSISLINVQSSAALHKLGKKRTTDDPVAALATAEAALEAVKSTSKDALGELRSTLGMLRGAGEAAPTAPASGLAQLPELAERARSAGLDVRIVTQGGARELPPPLDLAAYRIVQESLTNVTRHARATAATITLDYGTDDLRLRIEDNGAGAPDGIGGGSGIRGMAERARAFGGELTTENTADGFRVMARLPFETNQGAR